MPRKRKSNEKKGADATANQCKTGFTKYYKGWCEHKGMPHVIPVVVDENGDVTDTANADIVAFVKWPSKLRGITLSKMQNTLSWYQTVINDQVGSKNKPAPVGHARRVKPVHDIVARMKKDRSEIERIDKNGNKTYLDRGRKYCATFGVSTKP